MDADNKFLTIYDKSERENIADKELLDLMQKIRSICTLMIDSMVKLLQPVALTYYSLLH